MKELWNRIKLWWVKLRLQPIHVYCMHHVCAEFDAESMNLSDWMQIGEFKNKVVAMRHEGIVFISLTEAYQHIKNDWFRYNKYAVLTFDDGYASQKEILPWLNEQRIPATLFLNPAYFDGKHFRERDTEKYLTVEEVLQISEKYPLVTVGSHGWEHINATKLSLEQFSESLKMSSNVLSSLSNFVPFYAFPYGECYRIHIKVVIEANLIPMTVFGNKNYCRSVYIDRELLCR